MSTDAELLHRYVAKRDERAFAELVQRHLGLVYSAALRRTGGRPHLAQEISQKVFSDLARKAALLAHHPVLTGWLYRSTRYVAIDAVRAQARRQKLEQSLAAMPDLSSPPESVVDWEKLRPVLDEAMDQLNERDREIMLLRFFQSQTYAEVGAKLNLTENTARMRTERAIGKLRHQLGKRGITSTASLAVLLSSQSLVAAPPNLAASVTTAAVAVAPAGTLATFFTTTLMNKIAITSLSTVLAAAITTVAWAAVADNVSDSKLADLRAENARLTRATAPGAPGASVTAIADEYAAQAALIVQTVEKRVAEKNAAGASQFRNHGQATPKDAFLTLAWARDTGDAGALAKILTYEEKGKEAIRALHAGLPANIRAQFPTPEEFVVFLFVADTLLRPLPGVDLAEKFVATETGPGRAVVGRPGATQGGLNWVQTEEGWKFVVPDGLPDWLAKGVLGNEMLDKLGVH